MSEKYGEKGLKSSPSPTFPSILNRLKGVQKQAHGQFQARCPAHEDRRASLSVAEGADGRVLVRCHAGCTVEDVTEALGLTTQDLFPPSTNGKASGRIEETYPYTDASGTLLYEAVRFAPKDFRQRRPDGQGGWLWNLNGQRVLYRLPSVRKAASAASTVFVVEGEKDADALAELGLVATCNPMGAGKWRPEYAEQLAGAHVVVIPDNDGPGRRHAEQVARSLHAHGVEVRILELPDLPEKGDVSDWLSSGGDKEKLLSLAAEQPVVSAEKVSDQNSMGFWSETKCPWTTAAKISREGVPETEYLIKNLLPAGALVLLTGVAKGGGKTTFALHGAKALTTGGAFLGRTAKQTPVVYLSEQPKGNLLSEYLKPIGLAASEDLHLLFFHEAAALSWEEVVAAAVAHAVKVGARVLMVDTFLEWARLAGDSENSSGYVNAALRPLKLAVAQHGLTVVIVHHDGKGDSDSVYDAGRGSSAFQGVADLILQLKRPRGNQSPTIRRLMTAGRFSAVPKDLTIELSDSAYVDHGDGTAVAFGQAVEAIKEALPGNEGAAMNEAELLSGVAQTVDTNRTTLRRALKHLLDQGQARVIGQGKRGDPYRYFRPTEEHFSFVTKTPVYVGHKETKAAEGFPTPSSPPAEEPKRFVTKTPVYVGQKQSQAAEGFLPTLAVAGDGAAEKHSLSVTPAVEDLEPGATVVHPASGARYTVDYVLEQRAYVTGPSGATVFDVDELRVLEPAARSAPF